MTRTMQDDGEAQAREAAVKAVLANVEAKANMSPQPDAEPRDDSDTYKCTACGKKQPHTIRRCDHAGAPRLCDGCHWELHKGDAR